MQHKNATTYLCFRDSGEIWTEIITDPFGTTRQSDTPYQQNQQDCVREESGKPDHLQQRNRSSCVTRAKTLYAYKIDST